MFTGIDPTSPTSGYFAAGARFGPERKRLRLLEARSDPVTFERLRTVGVSPGWRCLEVGAGTGSVAAWLREHVGAEGVVTATDVDTRFLTHLGAEVEIHEHDIVSDPLEVGAYDLVHCRSVLMHLHDPGAAVARMAAALRPDGWLVVENNDYLSFTAVSANGALAGRWNRAAAEVLSVARTQGLFASDLGRHLPNMVAQTGLRIITTDGRTTVQRGRDPVARFLRQSLLHLAGLAPFSEAAPEIDILVAGLDDPTFEFVDAINFGVSAVSLESSRCP